MLTRSWTRIGTPLFALSALGILVLQVSSKPVADSGAPDALSELPPPVRRSVERYVTAENVKQVSSESENGHQVFEVEFSEHETACSLEVSGRGEILEVERSVSSGDLPPEVREVLADRFPGIRIGEVNSIELHRFEIEMLDGNYPWELQVDSIGRVTNTPSDNWREKGGEEEDEDDD